MGLFLLQVFLTALHFVLEFTIGFSENLSLLITSVFCDIDITCFGGLPLEYEIDISTLKKRVQFLLESYDNGADMNQAVNDMLSK